MPFFLRILRSLIILSALLLHCAIARAQTGVDDLNPGANSAIYALTLQPDGKVIVAGAFTTLGGGGTGTSTRNYIGRLNADGSVDATFDPGANGPVRRVVLQPDGKIVVGGDFTMLGGGGTGSARNHIGRLNADGSLDNSFNPGADNLVTALALQPDGKVLVGGHFDTLGGGGSGLTPRQRIGRLDADGSIDTSFNPGASSITDLGVNAASIWALVVQPDGKIVVGGYFNKLGGGTGTTTRFNVGRLDADGSVDAAFNPGASSYVYDVLLQPDGKILLSGLFNGVGGGESPHLNTLRRHIARLNGNGSLDFNFQAGANDTISTMTLLANQKILVGGTFTTLDRNKPIARRRIGLLNADGSLDLDFNPGANEQVLAIYVQSDGQIVVGGAFSALGGGTGTTTRYSLGRVNSLTTNRSALKFVGTKAGADGPLTAVTSPQPVTVTFATVSSAWTAATNTSWLQVTNGSGTSAGQFSVSIVNPGNVIGGSTSLSGTITITAPPNGPTTIPVTLTIGQTGAATAIPFGAFDTPSNNASGLVGAIPVTGWALDDIGVNRVEVWRNCVESIDRPRGACAPPAAGLPGDYVFLARAFLLPGARPDVEAAYETLPFAYRAGWGFMLLTNGLPHQIGGTPEGGQGSYTLSAFDPHAATGTGIDTLHVWAYRRDAMAEPQFVGAAAVGGLRSDVAAIYGEQFEAAGFSLTGALPPGLYDLLVYPWSHRSARFEDPRVVPVSVR